MANTTNNFLQTIKFYDESLEEHYTMYDNMPYVRDWGLTGFDAVKMVSGNIIKYYRCQQKEDYYKIPSGQDSNNSDN